MLGFSTLTKAHSLRRKEGREGRGGEKTQEQKIENRLSINSESRLVVIICTPIMKETMFSCDIPTKS